MLEGAALGAVPWGDVGLVGISAALLVVMLRMIFSGAFVPRSQVELLLEDARKQNAFLQESGRLKDGTIAELSSQVATLTAQGELSVRLLESITAYGNHARSGSGHVAQAD